MRKKRDGSRRAASERLQIAFGIRLKQIRRDKGVVQKSLAKDLGLTRTSLSNIERGASRIYLDQAYVLADALAVSLSDLLPASAEVLKPEAVTSSPDNPLSAAATAEASQVVHRVVTSLGSKRGGRKQLAASKKSDRRKNQ